jgi:hypothetical protein
MTNFKSKIENAIEKAAEEHATGVYDKFAGSHISYCWKEMKDTYISGANFLLPVLLKAIEQRNWALNNADVVPAKNKDTDIISANKYLLSF